ncbi:hypothetical protein V1505DRAFT_402836 [Lipomyces doorenjongii]
MTGKPLRCPTAKEGFHHLLKLKEISKAEFRYLLNYQVLLDGVVFKKYALYTTLDFNFSALVREIEADSKCPSMQLAKTIAILQQITTRYQEDSSDLEEAQPRTKKRKACIMLQLQASSATSALLEAANKRRHQEELATEPSYKRQLLEKYRCCVKSCTNNGNTCFVRGQRHFPISAKHLNDWNESIKIGHATIHSLPSSIDPLPAKAPYPQLPNIGINRHPIHLSQQITITHSLHPITVLFLCQLKTQLLRHSQELHLQLPI